MNGGIVQKVKRQSKKRIFQKLKRTLCLVSAGKLGDEEIESVLASYKGHLFRGNGWGVYSRLWRITDSILRTVQ